MEESKFKYDLPQTKTWYFINDFSWGSVIATKENIEKHLIYGIGDISEEDMILITQEGYERFSDNKRIFEVPENQLYGKLFSAIL